jgi:hypothetical protein
LLGFVQRRVEEQRAGDLDAERVERVHAPGLDEECELADYQGGAGLAELVEGWTDYDGLGLAHRWLRAKTRF